MDLESVRGYLPSMTRERLGEIVTLTPMRKGKMGSGVDASRPILTLMARIDLDPEIEQLGGGRERPAAANLVSNHQTVSFARAELAWTPETGDRLIRTHPVTGQAEGYRIDRTYEPHPGILVADMSRI